jgi:hypothetical protein
MFLRNILTPATDKLSTSTLCHWHYEFMINTVVKFSPRMKMMPFVCRRERVIEYRLGDTSSGPLLRLPTESFVLAVGSRTSAPGGGSVAALLAALVSYIWNFRADVRGSPTPGEGRN